MTVSVAMATYNGMDGIGRQIESILMSLGEADELVISDDGSTDGTREFLQALAADDPRVTVIDGPRQGLVKNFENALSACRGEWIFLSDQDDVWEPDKYQTVLETAMKTGAILVMHDARVVDGDGNVLETSFFRTRNTQVGFWKNLWKNSYIGCCMSFSSRLLEDILPFPNAIPMHDQWIGMQAQRHGNVVLIDRPLLQYRRHGGNASAMTHGSLGSMLKGRLGMLLALFNRR